MFCCCVCRWSCLYGKRLRAYVDRLEERPSQAYGVLPKLRGVAPRELAYIVGKREIYYLALRSPQRGLELYSCD